MDNGLILKSTQAEIWNTETNNNFVTLFIDEDFNVCFLKKIINEHGDEILSMMVIEPKEIFLS